VAPGSACDHRVGSLASARSCSTSRAPRRPISFVYDVLFPYARTHLREFLRDAWPDGTARRGRPQSARGARGGRRAR
jgi:hypothetical protein